MKKTLAIAAFVALLATGAEASGLKVLKSYDQAALADYRCAYGLLFVNGEGRNAEIYNQAARADIARAVVELVRTSRSKSIRDMDLNSVATQKAVLSDIHATLYRAASPINRRPLMEAVETARKCDAPGKLERARAKAAWFSAQHGLLDRIRTEDYF